MTEERKRRTLTAASGGAATRAVLEIREGDLVAERWQVRRILGQGGFGVVVEVLDRSLDAPFALKYLSTVPLQDEELRILRTEALLALGLTNEHLVRVNHYDVAEGFPFLVMELLEEGDLTHGLAQTGPMAWAEARRVALHVADGLAHAHRKGLVHRDVKPNNVGFVVEAGERVYKLGDFGLAMRVRTAAKTTTRRTELPATAFTVEYSSPEQLSNRDVDARSDQFSLAVTLYQLVTGELPFRGDTPMHLMYAITTAEPRPLDVPGLPAGARAALFRAMAKDPGGRFEDVLAFAEAFASEGGVVEPSQARPSAPAPLPAAPPPAVRLAPGRESLLGWLAVLVYLDLWAIDSVAGGLGELSLVEQLLAELRGDTSPGLAIMFVVGLLKLVVMALVVRALVRRLEARDATGGV